MGSQTFQYVFADGTATDTINVTVSTPATNTTGNGLGYNVTAITGSIGGVAISGEVGSGGVEGTVPGGGYALYDNVVFASNAAGGSTTKSDNQTGSNYGIDDEGIEFKAGGVEYNLFYETVLGFTGFTLYTPTNGTVGLTLNSSTAPCYCSGTQILTSRGEVPVEVLTAGDTVVTATGQHRPIRWIGRRSYAGRFLAANPAMQPVLFRAGCLGDDLPRRDLRVSPLHAMFLDGVLIPAEHLVNGTTIIRDRTCNQVEYFHVELDTHDVVLAEGAPSESYVDDDNRGMFHNAADCPARELVPTVYCAPRVESGFALEAVRARLAVVAGQVALAA